VAQTQRVTFAIRGLDCASCAIDVGRALSRLSGVVEININYVVDRGYVDFDPAQTSWEIVSRALHDRGYTVARRADTEGSFRSMGSMY